MLRFSFRGSICWEWMRTRLRGGTATHWTKAAVGGRKPSLSDGTDKAIQVGIEATVDY